MGYKDLHFKLKGFWLRRLQIGDRRGHKKKKPLWTTPVSHGYYTVDRFRESCTDGSSDSDVVLVQREQIEDLEVWFFGLSDARIGNGIAKYLQTHLFDKLPNRSGVMRMCKDTMRKAHKSTRVKITAKLGDENEQKNLDSAASVVVVNGEKLAMANMGSHRVVVCRDGDAHQIKNKYKKSIQRRWSRMIFPACNSRNSSNEANPRSSEHAVIAERISSDIEFIIIASSGIWEVLKNQEAINLIRHIEDPQQAARCLAIEALNRLSKSSISCIVIRFD